MAWGQRVLLARAAPRVSSRRGHARSWHAPTRVPLVGRGQQLRAEITESGFEDISCLDDLVVDTPQFVRLLSCDNKSKKYESNYYSKNCRLHLAVPCC